MRTLRLGDKGVDVEAWQAFLLSQGFDAGRVDGDFGPITHDATKAFQRSVGIKVDGIVGPQTIRIAVSLGFVETLDDDLDEEQVEDFSNLVRIPDRINPNVSFARQSTMLDLFGSPGERTRDCSPVTNARVKALLVTEDVGPFRLRGMRPAVEAIRRVFDRVQVERPALYDQLETAGMLCCRRVRNGRNFSNHSWGTAVDLKINGKLDTVADRRCQLGLRLMAPFFNQEGFFWGAGFSREDAMHFEVSEQLLHHWKADGII